MQKNKRNVKTATAYETSDNIEGNPMKRLRVSRACDQCRLSREKCNGTAPCRPCGRYDRECTYREPQKKRGVQRNYTRALECTVGWLLNEFPKAERRLATGVLQYESLMNKSIVAIEPEATSDLQRRFKSSVVSQQIDAFLAGEQVSGVETVIQSLSAPEKSILSRNIALSDRSSSDVLQGSITTNGADDSVTGKHLMRLPDNAWKLWEHYLAFTYAWLPINEKHSILKLLYAFPKEGLNKEQMRSAEYAELWSILALAASQLPEENSQDQVQGMRRTAEELIPPVASNASFEVPQINAMLILALLDMGEQRMLAAWLRVGTVVSLLLLFPLLETLGATLKKCKHVRFAAFILEETLASHLGVPTHTRAPYMELLGFVSEDGLDEWSPWHDPWQDIIPEERLRSPARALSTLNDLIRIALRSSDQAQGADTKAKLDISIVFSLLQNARNRTDRVQPCVLLQPAGRE